MNPMDRPRSDPDRDRALPGAQRSEDLPPPADRPRGPETEETTEPDVGRRRIPYAKGVVAASILTGLPGAAAALGLVWLGAYSGRVQWTVTLIVITLWGWFTYALHERVVRPLQTLSNMLAALREGDFSIRARGAGTNDPLSLAFLEVNALEEILREQRLGAVEATATLRKVLEEIDLAVFAFDEHQRLRLVNRAGERLLGRPSERILGHSAANLRLDEGLTGVAPRTLEVSFPGGSGRWELRRSVVRQEGLRLQLLVLSDLSRALREEERQAWKRIIRVLSHEINNSLAPIKSISASLKDAMVRSNRSPDWEEDVDKGLSVISGRAEGLGRFMASYARLARLPQPTLRPMSVGDWVRGAAALETRTEVEVEEGPELTVYADEDQLEQLLINLIRNGVDAATETGGGVSVSWTRQGKQLHVYIDDDGPGISEGGNLFVPFFTTKKGGSGIGLVLSRQIAEGHGGSLTLKNRLGERGARAHLTLPTDLKPNEGERSFRTDSTVTTLPPGPEGADRG